MENRCYDEDVLFCLVLELFVFDEVLNSMEYPANLYPETPRFLT